MNIFLTQIQRKAVSFGLLAVLLAAVVAFLSIGAASLLAVQTQISAVSSQYTTIAIPKDNWIWYDLLSDESSGEILSLARQKIPGILSEDRRGILNAHVTDCTSVSCYEKGVFSNKTYDMCSRSLAVLAVRCISVLEMELPSDRVVYDDSNTTVNYEPIQERYFNAEFTLEEEIEQFPSYDADFPPLERIWIGDPYPPNGEMPFEEGKTYLLFGCISPSYKYFAGYDAEGEPEYLFSQPGLRGISTMEIILTEDTGNAWEKMRRGEASDFLRSWKTVQGEDGVYYRRMDEGTLPFYAEYTGCVEDFLNSNEGEIWRDTILPMCQRNYESANVILTDHLDSVLWFNTGDASIFEGRSFDAAEYANGEDVCLVSAAYALKNGLSVGDFIEMDFYRSRIATMAEMVGDMKPRSVECNIFEPCKEENRLGIKKNYRIVGVYSAPEFTAGKQTFSANTIFIPKASIPNASNYEELWHCLLYSVILENGKIDEFEAVMAERGCADSFVYFDQNYNILAETLDVMQDNAARMVLISSALFVLVAALFFFLFLRQTADPARKLRLLGVRAGAVRRQRYGAAVVLIVAAAVLGAAVGAVLYGAVTKRVLSGNIALQPTALLLAVAAQTAILLIAALICTRATARQNLMQKK